MDRSLYFARDANNFLEISRKEIFHHGYVLILFFQMPQWHLKDVSLAQEDALHNSVTKNCDRKIPLNIFFYFYHCKGLNHRFEI